MENNIKIKTERALPIAVNININSISLFFTKIFSRREVTVIREQAQVIKIFILNSEYTVSQFYWFLPVQQHESPRHTYTP